MNLLGHGGRSSGPDDDPLHARTCRLALRRLGRGLGLALLFVAVMAPPAVAGSGRAAPRAQQDATILLSDVVERPAAGVADEFERGRGPVTYLHLDPAELVDRLVPSLRPDAVDEERSCQSLEGKDVTLRVGGEDIDFRGVEATVCDPGDGSYVAWHGRRATAGGDILASASLAVIFDEDGAATGATGTVQGAQHAYELMPVVGDTYGFARILFSDPGVDVEDSAPSSDDGGEEASSSTTSTSTLVPPSSVPDIGGATSTTQVDGDAPPGGGGNVQPVPAPPADRSGIEGDSAPDAAPGELDGGQPRPGGPPGNRTIQVRFAFANGMTATQAYLYLVNRTEQTNDSFLNSNMPVRVEGLGPVAANYTPSGDHSIDLNRLSHPTDGPMDALKADFDASNIDALALLVPLATSQSCGVAARSTEVDANAPFVSVSAMQSGCDYTFTHELGHNLGAHHNPENASGPTAFPWSYGHYALGKGSDVMSYLDPCSSSPCPRKLQWSDPDDGFLGHVGTPSGTPYRDNDRSVTDTSWAASQKGNESSNDSIWYRSGSGHTSVSIADDIEAPYTPLSGDFDGDGRTDQYWYFPGTPIDLIWFFGSTRGAYLGNSTDVVGSYRPVVGDFDGDGRDDIFWHGAGTDPDSIWWGTAVPGSFGSVVTTTSVSGAYSPQAGDIDGDGRDDVVWYAAGAAADHLWWGNASRTSFASGSGSTGVSVNGLYHLTLGDHNGDGRDDLSWFQPGTGSDFLWHGMASRGAVGPSNQTNYTQNGDRIPKTGDLNGDGRDDVFWYGPGGEPDTIWWGQATMSSFASAPGWSGQTVSGHYSPTTGDFDGDGFTDLFWFSFG